VVNILLALNLQGFLIYPTLGGAVMNVVLNLWCIPHYGAVGAAWASVASYSFAWGCVLVCFKPTREIIWTGIVRATPVLILAGLATLLARQVPVLPIVQVTVAATLYIAGTFAVRIVKPADLAVLRSALHHALGEKA